MNHALSRLKKASSVAVSAGSGSGSRASTAPASGVDNNGNVLPAYGTGSSGSQRPLAMAEKTLPPGAAAYSHPSTQWDQAQRERDELERAMKLSEEQEQYEAALRASQEAEERENERRQKELQDEGDILRQSQADHEAHEDQLAIRQAEEEQAILQAIRESEREAARKTAAKGKQTRRSSDSRSAINSSQSLQASSSSSRSTDTVDNEDDITEDDDEELRKAMELSMRDQENERREQEELLHSAQQQRLASSNASEAQASTSTLPQTRPASSSSTHTASRPLPPHLLPPRPGRAAPPPPEQAEHTAPPALPARRRLSEDEEYASILEAPPPAYEASSSATGPSSQGHRQTSPAPSTEADTDTYHSAVSTTESAREAARALEEKRQVFYPPVATSEMAEGSMRAFVPHMLFAARRRERSDPDEWFPMASRDVDLTQLPPPPRSPASPASPAEQPRVQPTSRPRRPLPPLPARPDGQGPQVQPSALAQLDQKVASLSPISPTSPSYYTSSVNPSSASVNAPSTTRAVENDDYSDDPFDDSQAAHSDSEYMGPSSETDEHYNEHPSHTIHNHVSSRQDSSESQLNHVSHGGSTSEAYTDETETTSPRVARYDYAPTRSRENVSHLPRAHSPEAMNNRDRIQSEQQDLANGEGYMSGEGAVSWESTASEDDEAMHRRAVQPIDESAHDINTNISFGFNPLSSPTQHLDWQGRFPDLIVLSRFADADPRAATRQEDGTVIGQSKDDYRTFAFEAPTWRELLAYLMWHGNSIFEAASRDKESSTPESLKVSLILEFVKTTTPPSTLVRLQIHLLSASAGNASQNQAGEVTGSGARGVALSRQPLSSRPSNYVRSSLPWQQAGNKDSTHLVLAFPKPYHTLPFSLGTIGTHLHNAHKAAVAQQTTQADHRIQLGDKGRISNTQFLTDLLRGIDMCSDRTIDSNSGRQQNKSGSPNHTSPDDSRFDRFVGRLKDKRHNMRGTLRELHKSSRSKRRRWKQSKDKGKGTLDGRAEDSDESYLDSQPKAEDYHITPYPATS